jgi:hypothetical protein
MEMRKISYDNDIKEINIFNKNILFPTPHKENHLEKPDFSPIINKQNQMCFKKFGSYKKQKLLEPESPMKSPNFKTSAKMKGRNLFGDNNDFHNGNIFKKLNFDDSNNDKNIFLGKKSNNTKDCYPANTRLNRFLEKLDEEEEEGIEPNYHINNTENVLPSPKFGGLDGGKFFFEENEELIKNKRTKNMRKCSINIENNIEILKSGKFENDFKIIKTLKKDKFSFIYKVEQLKTNNIYCIRKIFKTAPKSNIDNLKRITQDFNNNSNNIASAFCVKNIEFWIEKEEFNSLFSDSNFCDKNLYILTKFYKNGDILDFLGGLEGLHYNFNDNFYWDMVFEMIMGLLFVHESGYVYIDMQPGNYLVDEYGYIKLNDFNLALRENEINLQEDIIEGDSRYISKELFHCQKNLNSKCDVFSLGLIFLELIAKIELPYNGQLWHELRDENFKLDDKYFVKSNTNNINEFKNLISQMILPFEKRPDLKQLINQFPQLSMRYQLVLNKTYKKSYAQPNMIIE